eukprot:gene11405-5200_t
MRFSLRSPSVASVTVAAIYAALGISIYHAYEGEYTWAIIGMSFWVMSGFVMSSHGLCGLADKNASCVPQFCRDICCRQDGPGWAGGDEGGMRELLLTLVHLRLFKEARFYDGER